MYSKFFYFMWSEKNSVSELGAASETPTEEHCGEGICTSLGTTGQGYQKLPEEQPPLRVSLVIAQLRLRTKGKGVFRRKLQAPLQSNGIFFFLFSNI